METRESNRIEIESNLMELNEVSGNLERTECLLMFLFACLHERCVTSAQFPYTLRMCLLLPRHLPDVALTRESWHLWHLRLLPVMTSLETSGKTRRKIFHALSCDCHLFRGFHSFSLSCGRVS